MQPKTKIAFKNFSLMLSVLVTVIVFLKMADLTLGIELIVFVIWTISPYVCFFLVTYLLERFTSIPQVPGMGFIIAVLMLGFTLLTYPGLLWNGHHSSTEGLIFIFAPFWLFVGSFPLLGLCVLVSWLSNKQEQLEKNAQPDGKEGR